MVIRIAKIIAFIFRLANFFFDCIQTWQYSVGGGMGTIITAIVTYFTEMPLWAVIPLSLAAFI